MNEFEQAVDELIDIAQKRIKQEYGEGGPNYHAYHNTAHTQSAIDAAVALCERASIPPRESGLCRLAVAFHDVVHNGDSAPDNEQLSADFASTMMKTSRLFTSKDIKHVEHVILATKCVQKYPKIIQSPLPHDYLAKLVCDADLSSFGKPYEDFYNSAIAFYVELYGNKENPVQLRKYLEVELTLLSNHTFWTKEAEELFPNASDNYKILAKKLAT